MAKKSKTEANARRRATVARYADRRAELVATIKHPATPDDLRAGTCGRSGSPGCACGSTPTPATCPA